MLTHDRDAYQDIRNAIDDTLWQNPPIANFAPHYPAVDTMLAGQKVMAGDLVMVSFAAATTGLARTEAPEEGSNRASLAWSAGPHSCPSRGPATHIAITAVENLLGQIPDIELAVPEHLLTWRPGPFHRALNMLPVRFNPTQPMRQPTPSPTWTATAAHDASAAAPHHPDAAGKWSKFLAWLKK